MAKIQQKTAAQKQVEEEKVWTAYGLAISLGYMIAIPIILFGIGGALLDKKINTFPIFTLIGFVLAMTISLVTVYRKTKDIISQGKIQKPKK